MISSFWDFQGFAVNFLTPQGVSTVGRCDSWQKTHSIWLGVGNKPKAKLEVLQFVVLFTLPLLFFGSCWPGWNCCRDDESLEDAANVSK